MKVGCKVIEVVDLVRTFSRRREKTTTVALDGISFSVSEGELLGILGPNGAGKTTLVRILSTLLTPTAGRATINGLDIVSDVKAIRNRIGVVFGGERGLYDRLSAGDNMRFSAELYGLSPSRSPKRIITLLEKVGLESKIDTRVETFSRGMKQRLHIARALLHDPDVIFLDEPSNGLDPVAARELRNLIRELKVLGKTIILTTHYMFEADELCDRVAVISNGQILTLGTPESIKRDTQVGRTFEFDAFESYESQIATLLQWKEIVDIRSRELDGYVQWTVRTSAGTEIGRTELAIHLGVDESRIIERPTTLEDAYVALVSKG